MGSNKIYKNRLPLIFLGMISLLLAMWGGVHRVGLPLPVLNSTLPLAHGPLMIGGFLGTLISLERAVATGRRWAYSAPVLCGLGGLLLIPGLQNPAGVVSITVGSAVLLAISIIFIRRQNSLYMYIMALGPLCWLTGNILWLAGQPFYIAVWFWAGFLIFTIAGERLELSRVLQLTKTKQALFLLAAGMTLTGIWLSPVLPDAGTRIMGAGLVALALWLFRYDVVQRTVRTSGLTRFMAVCLLSGYFWLMAGGLLAAGYGSVTAGPYYDALLHSIFVGFVFSMIFGHAPVIFQAVLGMPVGYRTAFYSQLILLHASLILRISGDIIPWLPGRHWGALGNVAAILLFVVNTIVSVRKNLKLSLTSQTKEALPRENPL